MKERIIINKQKMKLYNKNALDKLGVILSNENYEITDEDTLVDFIKEQFNNRKLTTNFAGILQELKYCIEFESMPETFDELCGLCKELNDKCYKKFMRNKIYLIEEDFIEFMGDDLYGFRINKYGTIQSNDFDQIFKINQTVPQMWNFIKLIVGEII